jgi:hypothetical protein
MSYKYVRKISAEVPAGFSEAVLTQTAELPQRNCNLIGDALIAASGHGAGAQIQSVDIMDVSTERGLWRSIMGIIDHGTGLERLRIDVQYDENAKRRHVTVGGGASANNLEALNKMRDGWMAEGDYGDYKVSAGSCLDMRPTQKGIDAALLDKKAVDIDGVIIMTEAALSSFESAGCQLYAPARRGPPPQPL